MHEELLHSFLKGRGVRENWMENTGCKSEATARKVSAMLRLL